MPAQPNPDSEQAQTGDQHGFAADSIRQTAGDGAGDRGDDHHDGEQTAGLDFG